MCLFIKIFRLLKFHGSESDADMNMWIFIIINFKGIGVNHIIISMSIGNIDDSIGGLNFVL